LRTNIIKTLSERSRADQGLPPTIVSPAVLARVAAVLRTEVPDEAA
jgi:hypothetical protein